MIERNLQKLSKVVGDIPSMLDSLEYLDDELEKSKILGEFESTDELRKEYENIKDINDNCEINNLPVYVRVFLPEKIEKLMELLKTDSEKINRENIQKNIDTINSQILLLEGIENLTDLFKYNSYGKYKREKLNIARKNVNNKLENSTLTFTEPFIMELSIKKLFTDDIISYENMEDFSANKAIMKIYMYIGTVSKQNMIYVYFLILAISSLHHPKINEELKNSLILAIEKLSM